MDNTIIFKILENNNINYTINNDTDVIFSGFGLGDLLYSILCFENDLFISPINISVNFFLEQFFDIEQQTIIVWNENLKNSLEFRVRLINDICKHSKKIKINNFCFLFNENNIVNSNQFNVTITDLRLINNFRLNLDNNFFNNFDDDNFIVFHTKLRLTSNHNYEEIKMNLRKVLSTLKIKESKNIYIIGEKAFKTNYEGTLHNIQTIYEELLELKKNNEVIDLTVDEIYNSLNYENYKRDISIIKKAKWNIILGHGGHLTSSLIFGNVIFYDPMDEYIFYNNINLYNSGHRYFKRFEKFCEYLSFIL